MNDPAVSALQITVVIMGIVFAVLAISETTIRRAHFCTFHPDYRLCVHEPYRVESMDLN